MGPYKDLGRELVTNSTMGNIDPSFFLDGTQHYLIYKEVRHLSVQPAVVVAMRSTARCPPSNAGRQCASNKKADAHMAPHLGT